MTRDETGLMLEVLVAAFPGQQTQFADAEATITAYHFALDDVPAELAQLALRDLIRNAKFFPRPAEIRAAALKLARPVPTPQEAWGTVLKEMRRIGSYGQPEFEMAEIAQAVKLIGWRNLCMSEDIDRLAKRFEDAYAALTKKTAETANVHEIWSTRPALKEVS